MRKQKCLIVIALLLTTAPLAAQDVISRGDDGWKTPGGGGTQINLASYPIGQVLGSEPTSSIVSLKGKPLDAANLGTIDTIVTRPNDITISGGTGSGDLVINALSLESEGNIVLRDGRSFKLRVCLSDTGNDSGTATLARTNSDGGTFDSSFEVRPRLIFTPTGGGSPVAVDCGSVGCASITIAASNTGWVNTGGAGGFDPTAKGVTPIRSGIAVDADCDGVKDDYTTIGKGSGKKFYAGFAATTGFPAVSVGERHEDLSWHQAVVVLDCASTSTDSAAASSVRGNATAVPAPAPALCPAKVATPVGD